MEKLWKRVQKNWERKKEVYVRVAWRNWQETKKKASEEMKRGGMVENQQL